jgi:23S rRNA (adenine2503-C2)-methyltransferase
MDGFNDSLADAERLFGLLKGIPYKVNVIPYNENPDRDIKTPTPDRVKAFQHFFVSRGEHCSVRVTRGTDISAACGQLGGAKSQAKDQRGLPEAQKVAGLSETKRGLI